MERLPIKQFVKEKGLTIIEIILAIMVFALFSTGVFYLSLNTLQRDSKIELDNVALLYAQEGLEAIRNIRDRDFLALTNGDHGLAFSADTWSFIAAPEDIDGFFVRTITIEDVYRDVSGNIITESGVLDPDTKFITSEIDWYLKGIFPRSVTLSTYLSNWPGTDWLQTTCGEFNTGTFANTETSETSSPPENNCALQLADIENPSTFFSSADIGYHGNDVAISGNYAYTAHEISASGLVIVNISDPNTPTVVNSVNIGHKGRDIIVDGNYAYLGVERTNGGLAIVDISNPLLDNLLSTLDIIDYGNNLTINGNNLYVAVNEYDRALAIVDVTNKSSPTILGALDVNDEGFTVALQGKYALLGMEHDNEGFMVVDISNSASPLAITTLDVGEEVNAIAISYPFAFLGTEDPNDSLQVINISNILVPTLVNSLDVNGEIEDLVISGEYLYAAVSERDNGLAAINISNPLNPTLSYNLDITGKGSGIATDGNYIYLTTKTNNRGLVIVGTTVSGVQTSGTYISQAFDTGSSDTRYNFIEWEHIEIPGGTLRFQLRTSDTLANLSSATWVGANGTNATFYENSRTPIILDPVATGARYFQFQAFFDSDGVSTPSLESVRINYNP